MAGGASTFSQDAFRARNDDGTEATATWLAPLNTSWTQYVDQTFRVRFLVSRPSEAASPNGSMDLYVSHNGGTFEAVSATVGTSAVRDITSYTLDAQDSETTQQLGSGTPLPTNKGVNNNTGYAETGTVTWTAGTAYEAELEYALQIVGSKVEVGDTLELRVRFNGATFTGSYTNYPIIIASNPARLKIKGQSLIIKGATLKLK